MIRFKRHIGIDYSGARGPDDKLQGLQVFVSERGVEPSRFGPMGQTDASLWSRQELANWLQELLTDEMPTAIGIDHGVSFPTAYMEKYGVGGIPHAFVVKDGEVAWHGHPMTGLDDAIEDALK